MSWDSGIQRVGSRSARQRGLNTVRDMKETHDQLEGKSSSQLEQIADSRRVGRLKGGLPARSCAIAVKDNCLRCPGPLRPRFIKGNKQSEDEKQNHTRVIGRIADGGKRRGMGCGCGKTAVDALNCTDDSCPYPTDLYKSDPVYAHDIESNLSAAGMANLIGPSGKLAGPEDPLSPVQIGARPG